MELCRGRYCESYSVFSFIRKTVQRQLTVQYLYTAVVYKNWSLRSDCFMVAVYRKTNCALFSADIPQHCDFIGCECANERVKMSGVCAFRCQGHTLLTSYVIVAQHLTLSDWNTRKNSRSMNYCVAMEPVLYSLNFLFDPFDAW